MDGLFMITINTIEQLSFQNASKTARKNQQIYSLVIICNMSVSFWTKTALELIFCKQY